MTAVSATAATGVVGDLRTAWTFVDVDLPPDRVEVMGNRGGVELVVEADLDIYAEGRRVLLPAPFMSDQGVNLAALQRQPHVVERDDAPERLGDATHFQRQRSIEH